MQHADEFRRCLEELDTEGIRRLWGHVSPHLPQPATKQEALIALHYARTSAESIRLPARAYSHRWLLDHGYPSGLPDDLKTRAERLYPVKKMAVGISVNFKMPELRPLGDIIRTAQENAVMEAESDGKLGDAAHVKARMKEARTKALKSEGFGKYFS